MRAAASPNANRMLFECLWCHSLFDATPFSPLDLERGPRCLICGDLLEQIEVEAFGDTEGIPGNFPDETVVGFWH